MKRPQWAFKKMVQSGAVAKSYMTNGLLIYREILIKFLIYCTVQGNSEWGSCKVICIRKGFLVYEEMRKYFPIYMRMPLVIYDFATATFFFEFPYM
jgi:hypothetical protein